MPRAINDRGQIVGFCEGRFLLWERATGWLELGKALEYLYINSVGQIAGTVEDPNYRMQSSLWDPTTGRNIKDPNYSSQAFLWDPNEGLIMLGTLGTGMSAARALNNRGQIVGRCRNRAGRGGIFVWSKTQGVRFMGVSDSAPVAMNDAGQVIGHRGSREPLQPVLWEFAEDGSAVEILPPSGAFYDINNDGYVLGSGFHFDKQRQYALLWRQGHDIEWLFLLRT